MIKLTTLGEQHLPHVPHHFARGVPDAPSPALPTIHACVRRTALPTLDACGDTAALVDKLPLPTNPLQRAEVDALARDTIDIDVVLRASGTLTGVGDRARAAVERARKLGHPEGLAAALRVIASIHHVNEEWSAELTALREATVAAAGARDDRMIAELWSKQLRRPRA